MPFVSQAQRRLFYAKATKGEIKPKTVKEWESKTKGDLPEKVSQLEGPGSTGIPGSVAEQTQQAVQNTTTPPPAPSISMNNPMTMQKMSEDVRLLPPDAAERRANRMSNVPAVAGAALGATGGGLLTGMLASGLPRKFHAPLTVGGAVLGGTGLGYYLDRVVSQAQRRHSERRAAQDLMRNAKKQSALDQPKKEYKKTASFHDPDFRSFADEFLKIARSFYS